jgi:hypothetical protein
MKHKIGRKVDTVEHGTFRADIVFSKDSGIFSCECAGARPDGAHSRASRQAGGTAGNRRRLGDAREYRQDQTNC